MVVTGNLVSKSKLRIAVVGAGLIGCKHIELVMQHAKLDAIIDPDEAAKQLADTHHCSWDSDLETYLKNAKPDGVIIASPNKLHLPHGMACLSKGIPVLIEKPLAETAAAARELSKMSTVSGTPILVGHHRRHSPVIQAAKTLVDSGRMGRLAAVSALFWLNKPDDYFNVEWRTKIGGGPTYINLIHDIDLLQFLCGPIASVQAKEGHSLRGFEVEDTAAAILEFESGLLGTVSICDAVSAPWSWELTSGENPAYPQTDQSCYFLAGTKGSLSLPDLRFWTHAGPQSWWSPMDADNLAVPPADPVEIQFRHFLNVIEGREAPVVSAIDGARNIEVLDAIKAAAIDGGVFTVGG